MNDPTRIDPERLAALLDGRLSPAEAAAVRAQLANADEDTLGAYADAIAIAGAQQGDAVPGDRAKATDVPIGTRRARWLYASGLLAAAAIVAGVLLSRSRSETNGLAGGYQVAMYVAALPPNVSSDTTPLWASTRGAGVALNERARSARIGVLLADLEIAARTNAPTGPIAAQIEQAIADIPGGSPVSLELRAMMTQNQAHNEARRADIGDHAIALVDAVVAKSAAWLEVARVAARAGDTTFVKRSPPHQALDGLREAMGTDSIPNSRLKDVLSDTSRSHGPSEEHITGLLRALTR